METNDDWQPIDTCPYDSKPKILYGPMGYSNKPKYITIGSVGIDTMKSRGWTHWRYLTPPKPDPMTVAAWHPMEKLPDGHSEQVLVKHNGTDKIDIARHSKRANDNGTTNHKRVAWCPLQPLLDLMPQEEN